MQDFFNKPASHSLLCFLGGSLCALGMAPYNIWPVFFVGLGILYWATDAASTKKSAFFYGWLWAFGYFVFSLYWIGNALLVEGNPYKWAWPLAICGLPALLAFFNGFACLAVKHFSNLKHWTGYIAFACILSLFEYLRGHLFTGFPWNLYGYTWVDMPIALLSSFESVYLLTFITLLWMSIPGFWIAGEGSLSKRVLNTLILISFFGSFYLTAQQFKQSSNIDYKEDISIKIVQPNTPQHEKWERDKMDGHFQAALDLSKASETDTQKTLIVWPETTLSPAFLSSPFHRDNITALLREYSDEAILMTGALRYKHDSKTYYNSLMTFDASGDVEKVYDKSHLVPFGEYIPFQQWIPLAPVTQFQGFQKGGGLREIDLFDNFSYSPLICYEIIFPNKTIAKSSAPDFIVNVTNDAWYGDSPGPHQHLVKARFRAIEEGMPVLRAANTGISAIIDPYGRILNKTETFTQNILISNFPQKREESHPKQYLSIVLFPLLPLTFVILLIANPYIRMLKN